MAQAPRLFRILVPALDLETSRRFYEILLGTPGRRVAPGRYYFDAGPVIVGVIDFSGQSESERPRLTEAVYFATDDLESFHARARALGCLSRELLHGDPESPMGEIRVRPWGERSFYADDPAGNPLCFVDERTVFTGTPEQVAALARDRA
jgi:catechol 2,3-dioxygenase-like lactoylglutathione lyase family enzyme